MLRSQQDERLRADRLLALVFCGVTGFNAVLLYHHAVEGTWGWLIILLVVGVVFPGLIPYAHVIQALRRGRLRERWREAAAASIGAIDSMAILTHWPDALIDVSWVSAFIIGTLAAFVLVSYAR
jgi:hypothetical protein